MSGFLRLPVDIAKAGITEADSRLIERAYVVAAYWHGDQRRKSGDPYIVHPAAVAATVATFGMGVPAICAALLHDVISDTACRPEELHREFGQEITGLVKGFTEWRATGSYATAIESAEGPLLKLKLADRMHNMQTMRFLAPAKQKLRSQETLDYFVPLAASLGMKTVGQQLRKLALGIPGSSPPPTYGPDLADHRAIIAVDIENSTRRTDLVKAQLRQSLYDFLEQALHAAGLTEEHRDPFMDRGDGVLTLIHPVDQAPTSPLLDTVVPELGKLLWRHNAEHPDRRIRLRAVVHTGQVHYDRWGCFGAALDLAFRLLDAPALKETLRRAKTPLVLIVSEEIYRDVVRHGHGGLDHRTFAPRVFTEVSGRWKRGWIRDPDPMNAGILE